MPFRGPGIEPWWFGDGQDGVVTIAAPATLTQDRYYKTLVVNAALNTAGYRIFASNKITVGPSGVVRNNGSPGVGMNGGAGGPGAILGGGTAGGSGVSGEGNGGAATAQTLPCPSVSSGGNGGDTFTSPHIGGDGAICTFNKTTHRGFADWMSVFNAWTMDNTGALKRWGGGGGGGGGAGTSGGGGGTGGGGGGGGGIVFMAAPEIELQGVGTVQALGANGANATGSEAGGGGGGGGGLVILVCAALTGSGISSVMTNGGNGGNGVGGAIRGGQPGLKGWTLLLGPDGLTIQQGLDGSVGA